MRGHVDLAVRLTREMPGEQGSDSRTGTWYEIEGVKESGRKEGRKEEEDKVHRDRRECIGIEGRAAA